jgi:ABC-type phosphate transport system substrate-binding protein
MSFKEALQQVPEIHKNLSKQTLKDIFSGKIHRRMAEKFVDKMIILANNNYL